MLALAAGVTAFPLALVALSFLADEGVEDRMRERVCSATGDARVVLARDSAVDRGAIDAVAEEYGVRLRVIEQGVIEPSVVEHGATVDANHDGSSLALFFFTDDGAPSLHDFDATLAPVLERPEARLAADDTRVASVGCRTASGGRLSVCHAARTTRVGDRAVLIYAQESSRRSVRALFDLRYQLLKLTLIVLPLSLLLAWWLGRRFVRPIEALRAQVHDNLRTPTRVPIELDRGDELGELASAFDHLIGQLDTRARSNEAFLADVVHELKSPVATVRACAETLEGHPLGPERAARLSRALGASARRMESLLGRLLELARAEAGMPDASRESIELGPLTQEVVDEASLRHPGVAIALEVHEPHSTIVGVPDALSGAVRNLVDNAAAFGTAVLATVDQVDDQLRLTIEDDGPGIAPDDLPRVFERFFTTRRRVDGAGLGLSLVRAVVEAHGGRVEVSSTVGEGARFTVLLPA